MSAGLTDNSSPAPGPTVSPIAGFWRRLTAFAIDVIILSVPLLALGLARFRWAVSLGEAGRLIGFVVALLYFGLLNSRLGGGQTLGKRLLHIRVAARDGEPLSPLRSSLRFLVVAIPYFADGLYFNAAPTSFRGALLGIVLVFLVFGGLGAIVYLFVFNRRTRQSLHDLAVGSFVIRRAASAVPSPLVTPRLHLVVAGSWLALALIGPAIGVWLVQRQAPLEVLKPLDPVQLAALRAEFGVTQVVMTRGTAAMTSLRSGTSSTAYLLADVRLASCRYRPDAATPVIAASVLRQHPDLLGARVLMVQVRCGFDLGLAHWAQTSRQAFDAVAWWAKLRAFGLDVGPGTKNWVHYYEIGAGKPPDIAWLTHYYIDADSIRYDGGLLTYRTKVFHAAGGQIETFDIAADCATKRRGQLPSHDLYQTYDGTVGGAEVALACQLAALPRD